MTTVNIPLCNKNVSYTPASTIQMQQCWSDMRDRSSSQ